MRLFRSYHLSNIIMFFVSSARSSSVYHGLLHIWVKFLKVYIFPKYCHFFCNFDSCFLALFALVLLFQLFLWVNHMCQSRENQVFDPSSQVRYLKSISKHGQFYRCETFIDRNFYKEDGNLMK